ncbi:MAG TPA: hypothetical protein VGP68_13050, partial [Gemmataceae bacterium]|nr:hypothetical protein [Gemmataceae bacterium]
MTLFKSLLELPIMTRLGWVLLHSIWQVAAVAMLLALVSVLCRKRGAQASYAACCAALLLTVALPAVTFFLVPGQSPVRTAHADAGARLMVDAANDDARAHPETPEDATTRLDGPAPIIDSRQFAIENEDNAPVPPPAPIPAVEPVTKFGGKLMAATSSWLPWLVLVWLLGVAALSVWNLGGWMAVQRLKAKGTSLVSLAIQHAATRLAQQL